MHHAAEEFSVSQNERKHSTIERLDDQESSPRLMIGRWPAQTASHWFMWCCLRWLGLHSGAGKPSASPVRADRAKSLLIASLLTYNVRTGMI
jgi:hypothetical protein